MRPAHQGLETFHLAGRHGDFRLVHERQAIAIDGATQVGDERQTAAMLLIASRAIYGGTRRRVRRVFERHLRPAQQYCRGITVIGIHTNTARDVQIEADPGKMEARANDPGKLVRIQRRPFRTAVAGNDQELRFAEARDCVCRMGILP